MIIGIDADTHRLAYAVIDGVAPPRVRTLERANQAGRIDAGYDAALTALMRRAGEVGARCYLEGIYLAGRGNGSVKGFASLAEVAGEVKRTARQFAVPVEVVTASAWHSSVLGLTKGRDALKAAAMARAVEATGREDLNQHMADAVCIALYGAGLAEEALIGV